jgi:arylsulfatase A-like enzyme
MILSWWHGGENREKLLNHTILFFLTDNGGSKAMSANNTPLRGFKGSLYEGGIRTPFIVSWPSRFSGGRSIITPVISLDILPTVLDAVGASPRTENSFDGKSLLPLLTGRNTTHHDTLYWSEGGDSGEWAVRGDDWKLHTVKEQQQLFNLADDPEENVDLAAKHPEQIKALNNAFDKWIDQMVDPITGGSKQWGDRHEEQLTDRQKERRGKRMQQRRQREG